MKKQNTPSARMTRRQLAGVMWATAAAAQTPPQTPAAPATPATELQAAHDQNQRAAAALAKVTVPMDTEPAFRFSA